MKYINEYYDVEIVCHSYKNNTCLLLNIGCGCWNSIPKFKKCSTNGILVFSWIDYIMYGKIWRSDEIFKNLNKTIK